VWDGKCIRVFGAQNEVISFDVVLEAATSAASKVSVTLGDLTGPNGAVIRSAARDKTKVFDWTTTEVELFYVRYLQITGLSQQAYGTLADWQEATFPKRAQCAGMTQATPDNTTGVGFVRLSRFPLGPTNGSDVMVAKITFKALTTNGTTNVSIDKSKSVVYDNDNLADDKLTSVQNTSVIIQ